VQGEADVATVRELFAEYARAVGVDRCFQGFDQEVASLPGSYAGPRAALLLARVGSEPMGCAGIRPLSAAEAELKRLYVRPAGRGLGLGRRLAEVAIERAIRFGYAVLRLDTLPAMHEARVLYASLGFRETPPLAGVPDVGTIWMALEL
jgi:GNAT superfamily N-acetyltransferase